MPWLASPDAANDLDHAVRLSRESVNERRSLCEVTLKPDHAPRYYHEWWWVLQES